MHKLVVVVVSMEVMVDKKQENLILEVVLEEVVTCLASYQVVNQSVVLKKFLIMMEQEL